MSVVAREEAHHNIKKILDNFCCYNLVSETCEFLCTIFGKVYKPLKLRGHISLQLLNFKLSKLFLSKQSCEIHILSYLWKIYDHKFFVCSNYWLCIVLTKIFFFFFQVGIQNVQKCLIGILFYKYICFCIVYFLLFFKLQLKCQDMFEDPKIRKLR